MERPRETESTKSGPSFSALVDLEAHDEATAEQIAFLKAPENLERWRKALRSMKRKLDDAMHERAAQLQSQHDECLRGPDGKRRFLEHKTEYEEWRRAAAPFRKKIGERLRMVKRLLLENPSPRPLPVPERKEPPVDVVAWAARLIPDEGEGAYWHATVRALRLVKPPEEDPTSTTARRRRNLRAKERMLRQLDACRSERARRELLESEGLTLEIIQKWRKSLGEG